MVGLTPETDLTHLTPAGQQGVRPVAGEVRNLTPQLMVKLASRRPVTW